MTEHPSRRTNDNRVLDIEGMIAEENDPSKRATLIVLSAINNSLVANTVTVREVSYKLETHLTNFEKFQEEDAKLVNQGRGMWKVSAWVLGLAQLVGIALVGGAYQDLTGIHNNLTSLQIMTARLESRISAEENKP